MVKRRVCDRKVAGSRFDSRTSDALFCPWEKRDAYFPLVPSSPPVVVAQPDQRLETELKKEYSTLVWFDRRRVPG